MKIAERMRGIAALATFAQASFKVRTAVANLAITFQNGIDKSACVALEFASVA